MTLTVDKTRQNLLAWDGKYKWLEHGAVELNRDKSRFITEHIFRSCRSNERRKTLSYKCVRVRINTAKHGAKDLLIQHFASYYATDKASTRLLLCKTYTTHTVIIGVLPNILLILHTHAIKRKSQSARNKARQIESTKVTLLCAIFVANRRLEAASR